MTTLFRPRHGAGGQVDARGCTLDCCALEHRLLFSAAPLDPTLPESFESEAGPLESLSHHLNAEHSISIEFDHLIDLDQIQNEAITCPPFTEVLESWIVNGV